ncbi:acid phosphatase/Vanadium-dependent haloperoxidase [Lepidopterella palustris CBS 459.81]|uniref:Acid phosphatase/Vanadium-dependent haloperoxidase n=1 Tax=Lepidopterella palustris CBS 459.81 TaxID=1314670 RepID=A0A8E2JBT9_9PEZI|nr:acid phosphatase/Vanadium-dependent haloperoxidase [Lepidopterella palustris CBS 459.81]
MKKMNIILPSKRLIASYIFDWIVIIAIAAVGAGWNSMTPNRRPFSLVDLDISFPYVVREKIPTWLLVVVSLIIPAGIIFLVCLIFVPGPTASKQTPKSLVWRRKMWEWNVGWMGLALSLATSYMITQGMKQLFGKPRPDLLARCNTNMTSIPTTKVSSDGTSLSPLWVLVSATICQQTDTNILNDGFRSFPSGHSSLSWAGLLYLTLFLCSKFAIAIPFLPPTPYAPNPTHHALAPSLAPSLLALPNPNHPTKTPSNSSTTSSTDLSTPLRNRAAAPPIYILLLALIPLCAAIYISSTRYSDFRHHGFDIFFGSFIGITTAWFSFRWYHLPVRQGAGWAWGARSWERAWGIGVGVGGYVGSEGWRNAGAREEVGGGEVRVRDSGVGRRDLTGEEAV